MPDPNARARFAAFLDKPEHQQPHGPELIESDVVDDPTEPDWHKAGKDAPPGWRRNAEGDFEEDE